MTTRLLTHGELQTPDQMTTWVISLRKGDKSTIAQHFGTRSEVIGWAQGFEPLGITVESVTSYFDYWQAEITGGTK